MHTKDFLAEQLRAAGLTNMADLAAAGYYHDFLSPLAMPGMALLSDLAKDGTDAAMAIRKRAMAGEFEASADEAEAWSRTRAGREAFSALVSSARKPGGKPPRFKSRHRR